MTPPQLTEDELDQAFEAIVAAVGVADRDRAIALATAAVQQGLDEEPLVLILAAEGMVFAGRVAEALPLLKKATELGPEEAEVWRRYGDALALSGSLEAALSALQSSLTMAPDLVPASISAGAIAFRLGRVNLAEDYYRRAHEVAPDNSEVLAGLAATAAWRGDAAAARAAAERALALQPTSLTAEVALGRVELLENQAPAAADRMTRLLSEPSVSPDARTSLFDLRADAYEIMDRAADAFADYQARNEIQRQIATPRLRALGMESRIDEARRLSAYFSTAPAAVWRASSGRDTVSPVAGHIFLVGFPRSGTTLLEKALDGHPAIATLEELNHLGLLADDLLANPQGLDHLAGMAPPEADARRRTYWQGVRATAGDDLAGKVLVDKLPLHTLLLPVIAKLFPDAKILFALRDPRDVVLSCFRRRFQLNTAMYEFLTLEGAARYYDQVMTLAQIYREQLPLPLQEVRHEAVVADFEGELRQVLAFIGLDWRDSVADFAGRARERGEAVTPSDVQLARGLNAEGIGQWRRYQAQMARVLPRLEPWVRRFDYPASPALPVEAPPRSWGFGFQINPGEAGGTAYRPGVSTKKP